jgi:hypothetical protein
LFSSRGSVAGTPALPLDWKARATYDLDKYRKRDVVLTMTDAADKPAANATVDIRQTRKAFPFGFAIGTINEEGRRFEALMAEWSTNLTHVTDARRQAHLRGFTGEHAITIGVTTAQAAITGGTGAQPLNLRLSKQ